MKPINLLFCTALYMSGFLFASADTPGTTNGTIGNGGELTPKPKIPGRPKAPSAQVVEAAYEDGYLYLNFKYTGKLTGSTRLLDFMTETTPFNSECRECHAFPICSGGCAYYRLRNYKDDAKFTICSQYKDNEKLRRALLAGIKPEFA